MDFSQCCKNVYPSCKGIQSQGIYVAKLFRAGGSNRFNDSPYSNDGHDYEKKLFNGTKPLTTKLKQSFVNRVNVAGINQFLAEHIEEEKAEDILNAFGVVGSLDTDVGALAEAVARQYQLIFESPDANVEDITATEYRRILTQAPEDDLQKYKPLYSGDSAIVSGCEKEYQQKTDEKFRHVWEIRNSGTITWNDRKLVFIKTYRTGPLSENVELEVPKMEPGTHKKIATVIQTRGKEGNFSCHFEMHDSDGKNCFPNHSSLFDVRVKVDFVPETVMEV